MKTSLIVLFAFFACSFTFAQEQPQSSEPKEPADKLTVIKKGDFAVNAKVNSGIATDQELDDLATKIVTKLQEKVDSGATAIGCNMFVSVNPLVNKTTGKLRRVLEIGVYTSNSRSVSLYTVGKLPKSFTEKDQADAIDQTLNKVLEFQCPPSKAEM